MPTLHRWKFHPCPSRCIELPPPPLCTLALHQDHPAPAPILLKLSIYSGPQIRCYFSDVSCKKAPLLPGKPEHWFKVFSVFVLVCDIFIWFKPSLLAQSVKDLPAMQEIRVQSLDGEDPLNKGKASHSSILAWRIPWTEGPDGLQSMGLQSWTQLTLLLFTVP